MPHLHVNQRSIPPLPIKTDGIDFLFSARNIYHTDEYLVATVTKEASFFLLYHQKEKNCLLKSDKLTRPTATHVTHNALRTFADLAKLDILECNVPDKTANCHLQNISVLKNPSFFLDLFPVKNKVVVEIGFGSGRHLLYQAKQHPQTLFIGIEIHKASIEQVIKQINIQELENVYLLDYDARLFLELLPSNSIETIYVHFPVPWDKKPHRRVISKTFVEEAYRVLNKDGTLQLRTDSENYYNYAFGTFMARQKVILDIKKNQDINITSKYEARWQKMQKNIYDLIMHKDQTSAPQQLQNDFRFTNSPVDADLYEKVYQKTLRFENGFVHVERAYKIEENNGLLFRISMGSFDRPEHLYIVVDAEGTRYFPKPPLASKTNMDAHKILDGLLHG
jgi:tRNA (guanine-N7-)-methyltransferase